jgi:hypothetical protein
MRRSSASSPTDGGLSDHARPRFDISTDQGECAPARGPIRSTARSSRREVRAFANRVAGAVSAAAGGPDRPHRRGAHHPRLSGAELPDPGGIHAGRVGALVIRARVLRADRGGGEGVGARLIQGQVDVGERKPGAVHHATRVYRQRRRLHCGGRKLSCSGHILSERQRLKRGLGRGVTCVHRRAPAFGPRKPLRIGAVFRGRNLSPDVDLKTFLLNHLPRGRRG